MITKTHVNRCILQNQNSKSKLQDKNYWVKKRLWSEPNHGPKLNGSSLKMEKKFHVVISGGITKFSECIFSERLNEGAEIRNREVARPLNYGNQTGDCDRDVATDALIVSPSIRTDVVGQGIYWKHEEWAEFWFVFETDWLFVLYILCFELTPFMLLFIYSCMVQNTEPSSSSDLFC